MRSETTKLRQLEIVEFASVISYQHPLVGPRVAEEIAFFLGSAIRVHLEQESEDRALELYDEFVEVAGEKAGMRLGANALSPRARQRLDALKEQRARKRKQ